MNDQHTCLFFLSDLALSLLASTLTTEYSMNAPNTNTRHDAIHTSIALVKDTAGNRPWPELWVVIVSIVKMPRDILAGTLCVH